MVARSHCSGAKGRGCVASALAAQGVILGSARSLGPRPSMSGGTRSPPPPPLLHLWSSGIPTVADICGGPAHAIVDDAVSHAIVAGVPAGAVRGMRHAEHTGSDVKRQLMTGGGSGRCPIPVLR